VTNNMLYEYCCIRSVIVNASLIFYGDIRATPFCSGGMRTGLEPVPGFQDFFHTDAISASRFCTRD